MSLLRVIGHCSAKHGWLTAVTAAVVVTAFLVSSHWTFAEEGSKLNPRLSTLPPNIWVKFYQAPKTNWRRQGHAGMAYDSRRGRLLIFGSDTHGMDWDNEVHEFDPVAERWTTHYERAGKETYRADEGGNAIAGKDRVLPWAMHTFNNVLYDPSLDALVVTAEPKHNPIRKTVPGVKKHPTWIYDLKTRVWRIFENKGKPSPNFFAAGSVYDPDRDVIVAEKKGGGGIWEIGPERDEWKKVTPKSYHEIHFTMAYDTKHRKIAVFGDYKRTNEVWVYTPGTRAGTKGSWEKRTPGGDPCPRDEHIPVAFDSDNGVYLLVPDNWRREKDESGRMRWIPPSGSSTFVYDYATDRYTRLPKGDMERLGMNYMLVYDKFHKVFLLVTGDSGEPPIVWALKLDLKSLSLVGNTNNE